MTIDLPVPLSGGFEAANDAYTDAFPIAFARREWSTTGAANCMAGPRSAGEATPSSSG
jgi:hypothetical protein